LRTRHAHGHQFAVGPVFETMAGEIVDPGEGGFLGRGGNRAGIGRPRVVCAGVPGCLVQMLMAAIAVRRGLAEPGFAAFLRREFHRLETGSAYIYQVRTFMWMNGGNFKSRLRFSPLPRAGHNSVNPPGGPTS